jgi:hypothetical protein
MNTAIAILKHAVAMIFRDPVATLRAVAPGVIVMVIASAVLFSQIGTLFNIDPQELEKAAPTMSGGQALLTLCFVIVALIGFALMVVTWHRYVLLQGPDRDVGIHPSAGIVGRYIWKSILLGLLMIPALFVLGMFMAAFAASGGLGLAVIVQFVAGFALGWLIMRLSLVLPAAAIGKQVGFADSWRLTQPVSATILWVVLGLSVINLAAQIVGLATVQLPIVSFTVQMILSLVTTLIGVSCLTTLYGMQVEGRQIEA